MNRRQLAAASLTMSVLLSWFGFVLLRPMDRTVADIPLGRRLAGDASFLAARKLPTSTEDSQRALKASIQAQHEEEEDPGSELLCVCPTTIAADILASTTASFASSTASNHAGNVSSISTTRHMSTTVAGMTAAAMASTSTTKISYLNVITSMRINVSNKRSATGHVVTTAATIAATTALTKTTSVTTSMTQSFGSDGGSNASDGDTGKRHPAGCSDDAEVAAACVAWAATGECDANPDYMLAHCAKSCDRCPLPTSTISTTSTDPAPVGDSNRTRQVATAATTKSRVDEQRHPAGCSDDAEVASACVAWAANGECDGNSDYMLTHCAKSCDRCPLPTPNISTTSTEPVPDADSNRTAACSDDAEVAAACVAWAANGECDANPDYMLAHCVKSCDRCPLPTSTISTTTSTVTSTESAPFSASTLSAFTGATNSNASNTTTVSMTASTLQTSVPAKANTTTVSTTASAQQSSVTASTTATALTSTKTSTAQHSGSDGRDSSWNDSIDSSHDSSSANSTESGDDSTDKAEARALEIDGSPNVSMEPIIDDNSTTEKTATVPATIMVVRPTTTVGNAGLLAVSSTTDGSRNVSMEPSIDGNSLTRTTTIVPTTIVIVRPTTTTGNAALVAVSSTTLTVTCPMSCRPYNQPQDGKESAGTGDISSTTVKSTTTHIAATSSAEMAAASVAHIIEGSIEATIPAISDLDAYLSEPKMNALWQVSIAKAAGFEDEPERVVVVLSKVTRRLRRAALARLLAAGKLKVDYTITVPAAAVAEFVKQAFAPAKTSDLQNIVVAEIASMGLNATAFQPILEPLVVPSVKEIPVSVSTSAVPAAFEFAVGCVAQDLKAKLIEVSAESCEVVAIENPHRGTHAGKSESISAFLALGVCGEMAFLIHSIPEALRGMGLLGAVLVGLVIITWPIVALQVSFRCCRKSCGEPNEISQPGRGKRILIILLSVVGLGGMLAVAFGVLAGDLNAGNAEAESANCAARNFMVSALGDISLIGTGSTTDASIGTGLVGDYAGNNATGRLLAGQSSHADQDRGVHLESGRILQGSSSFLGFASARSKALAVSAGVEDVKLQMVHAVNNDGGAAASIKDALDLLNFAQTYLSSQFVVEGQECAFCKNAAQPQSGSIPDLLANMNGIPQSILDLGSDLQGKLGSRLAAAGSAFERSGVTMGLVQNSLESGPGGAMVMGGNFFTPAMRQVSMAFQFGAVPLSVIGLVFLLYGLRLLPCLKRYDIGQKQYPAAQWAACGWCGGCLAALVAGSMTCLCFAIASVSSDLCIMLETTGTAAGLELYTDLGLVGAQAEVAAARGASMACLSADAPSRDVFEVLSLSTHKATFSSLAADVDAVMQPNSMATIGAQFDALATDASSFDPLPATTYECREWRGSLATRSCDQTEFKASLRMLSDDLVAAGRALRTGVDRMQGKAEWQRLQNGVMGLGSSHHLAALESGLNCESVFNEYQGLQDQVCAGIAPSHQRAGMGWAIAGLLGFVGAFGQWWLWKTLQDNRSLFFDSFEGLRAEGIWKVLSCFLPFAVGDAEESHIDGSANAAKGGKGNKDIAVERISNKYFLAFFDITVEDAVKTYLQNEFFPTYDQAFSKVAVDERVASWKAVEKEKSVLGSTEVMNPGDPPVDPQTILKEYGPDRGPDGLPLRDADDQPLDTNKLAKLKKQLALLQKPWDRWHDEKRKYDMYLLRQIRMHCLKVNAQVEYTDEVAHLQPSTPGRTPKAVIVRSVPDDTMRAVWNDELATITAAKTDPRARRDKAVARKLRGLDLRCFQAPGVYDQLIQKLLVLADDPAIWDGVPVQQPNGQHSEEDAELASVPEAQRLAACEAAGLEVVRRLVDKLVFDHGEELAADVNKGLNDPADLARLLVQVEDVRVRDAAIDPVLSALRTLDKNKHSGLTNVAELRQVFRLLAQDKLKAGTHVSYGEITDEETAFIASRLEKLSMVKDGQVAHDDLKSFLEGPNAAKPDTLIGCLCAMRLERFSKGSTVDGLLSARDWRTQLKRGGYRV